jgi:exopolysaccharide production protein ExoZ
MGGRLTLLQGLRYFAALMAIYVHACGEALAISHRLGASAPGHLGEIGNAGVDIFFVLSGFVIARTGPFAKSVPTGTAFFRRRFTRVVPLFWFVSIPATVCFLWLAPPSIEETIATLFLWPAAGRELVHPYLGVGWTLTFEMLFYSAVSLVLVGRRIRRNLIAVALVVAALVIARHAFSWLGFRILANGIFAEFGFGVALAAFEGQLRSADARWAVGLLVAAFAAFAIEAVVGVGQIGNSFAVMRDEAALARVVVFGIPSAGVVTALIILEDRLKGAVANGFGRLGDASYSIYLCQEVVVRVSMPIWLLLPLVPPPWLVIASVLFVTTAIGILTHRYVERPLLIIARGTPIEAWQAARRSKREAQANPQSP